MPGIRARTQGTDDTRSLEAALAADIEALTESLLGPPAYRAAHEWRYGRKGSLAIAVRGPYRGRCRSFEAGEGGGALWLIRHATGQDWPATYAWARAYLGTATPPARPRPLSPATGLGNPAPHRPRRLTPAKALAVWKAALPIAGTLGEAYFRARGIRRPLPASLRFEPAAWHGEARRRYPAVLSPFQAPDGSVIALHRTYLDPQSAGNDARKADVFPAKRSIGGYRGTCIRLGPVAPHLALFEGIENALSIRESDPALSVWSAGAGGNLGNIRLPAGVDEVELYPDPGQTGLRDATKAALALEDQGIRVRIIAPLGDRDWNDILRFGAEAGG